MKATILNPRDFRLSANPADFKAQQEEFHYDLMDIAQFYIQRMGHPYSVFKEMTEDEARELAQNIILRDFDGKLADAYEKIVFDRMTDTEVIQLLENNPNVEVLLSDLWGYANITVSKSVNHHNEDAFSFSLNQNPIAMCKDAKDALAYLRELMFKYELTNSEVI